MNSLRDFNKECIGGKSKLFSTSNAQKQNCNSTNPIIESEMKNKCFITTDNSDCFSPEPIVNLRLLSSEKLMDIRHMHLEGSPLEEEIAHDKKRIQRTPKETNIQWWIKLERDVNDLMQRDLKDIENQPMTKQLKFFKYWFEVTYEKSLLYDYFKSAMRYLLMEHLPNFSSCEDYPTGKLFASLQKCLSDYRNSYNRVYKEFLEINRQMPLWITQEEKEKQEKFENDDELLNSYQIRLNSAIERAINAREQVVGLQTQLSQALIQIQQLERNVGLRNIPHLMTSPRKSRDDIPSEPKQLKNYLNMEKESYTCLKKYSDIEGYSNTELWKKLKEEKEQSIISGKKLENTLLEESAHKSQMLNITHEEIVESLEKSFVQSLMTICDSNAEDPNFAIEIWQKQLLKAISEREDKLEMLNKELSSKMIEVIETENKLCEKQNIVTRLDMEYNAYIQIEILKREEVKSKELQIAELQNRLQNDQTEIYKLMDESQQNNKQLHAMQNEETTVNANIHSFEKEKHLSNSSNPMKSFYPQTRLNTTKSFYVNSTDTV